MKNIKNKSRIYVRNIYENKGIISYIAIIFKMNASVKVNTEIIFILLTILSAKQKKRHIKIDMAYHIKDFASLRNYKNVGTIFSSARHASRTMYKTVSEDI